MHAHPIRRALAGACLGLLAVAAQAASVTCQSRNNQREDCTLGGRGEVTLARQISRTPCIKGRNWDETRQGIYVTDGCGGVFETRSGWGDRPGQESGWSGGGSGNTGNTGDLGDLVGVRAASGEAELRRRGLVRSRDESAPGGRFVFWRTPQRGCIEVRVADGRYQSIRSVNRGECDAGRPLPGDGNRPLHPKAANACMMQNSGEASGGNGDGTVVQQTQLSPGIWELVINFPNGRFACRVNERGSVLSFGRI